MQGTVRGGRTRPRPACASDAARRCAASAARRPPATARVAAPLSPLATRYSPAPAHRCASAARPPPSAAAPPPPWWDRRVVLVTPRVERAALPLAYLGG